jgi:probable addiction module antidote protein
MRKKTISTISNKKLVKQTRDYHDNLIEALQDPTESSAYLQVALEEYEEDGNHEVLLIALRNLTEARGGITKLAQRTHLNRQHLYRTLSSTGNPRLDTFGLILKGLGFHLSVQANG